RGAGVPRSRQKSLKRQMLSKLMTLGAMIGAGLMMVSTSLPANAFYPVQAVTGTVEATAAPVAEKAQSISVQAAGEQTLVRDNYTALSLRESLFLKYGNRNWSYTNDPNGTIQWPFPIAVPITDGYGPRIAPCGGCSTFHHGVDFTPGYGAAIQAIADGVVSSVDNGDWSYGENVIVDHVINGQKVQSLYAHMMRGSIRVVVGQAVKVGDEIGQVGSTGESTGPHLHLEIHINGVPVDPFEWLKANAN
ncbi:MAG TPA: peptidoglycan DD-metalloendopeptidase family protein, partial [Terrimesophilobacter sp.]|nr:peptidoglycan DD-metalloendopeptidase family protein [Terrimesophilobacter sp.]